VRTGVDAKNWKVPRAVRIAHSMCSPMSREQIDGLIPKFFVPWILWRRVRTPEATK
jgi:hypothetical protein